MRNWACTHLSDTAWNGNVFGFGFLGSELPVGSVAHHNLALPADAAKQYWIRVTASELAGPLFMWEDGSFDYVAPAEAAEVMAVELWEDGALLGPFVVTITATANIALGGDVQGSTQVTGGLSVRVSLGAAVTSLAVVSGGLTIVVPVSASALAMALAVGGLTVDLGAAGELHGDAFAQAVVGGELTTVNLFPALSGGGAGQSGATGMLTSPEWIDITASATAGASTSGTLTGGSPLTPPRPSDAAFVAIAVRVSSRQAHVPRKDPPNYSASY